MRLPAGTTGVVVTTVSPPTTVTYAVDAQGRILTSFGFLVYDPAEDTYFQDAKKVGLRFIDTAHIEALNGGPPPIVGTWAPAP